MKPEATPPQIEFRNPCGELDPHPLTKRLPGPNLESAEWRGFITALSAAGPDGIPPLVITSEGLVMDGRRRLIAAKRLQWSRIPCVVRPEWEAAFIIVSSLMGQHGISKSAKVYLSLGLLEEFIESAERRRIQNLKIGDKTLQISLKLPKHTQCASGASGSDWDAIAEFLGVSTTLLDQGIRIIKTFERPALCDHKFEFQDGVELTLREYFEPKILDVENPMGFGSVLKGFAQFLDHEGKPLKRPPPQRNTPLHHLTKGFHDYVKHLNARWPSLPEDEQSRLEESWKMDAREINEGALEKASSILREEIKRRRKAANRRGLVTA